MLTHTLPLSLPPQTHNPFFSTPLPFYTDFDLTLASYLPATFDFLCQNIIFISLPTLFFVDLLHTKPAYFVFLFMMDILSFLYLCFFPSAPSLCLVPRLCESQISASSGCRLYQQLPSLTPYFTFLLPLHFPFHLTSPLTVSYNVKCITLNDVTLLHLKNLLNLEVWFMQPLCSYLCKITDAPKNHNLQIKTI